MSRKKLQNLGTFFGVGDRIRKVRGKLSQEEFGKILGGVAKSTVSRYESGTIPPADALKKIAEFGNVTVDWLLRGDQAAPEPKLPVPEEAVTLESPEAPGLIHEPYVFGAIDVDALARIMDLVDEVLRPRPKPLKSMKKSFLTSLLYDEFQKTGRLPGRDLAEAFLRRIA